MKNDRAAKESCVLPHTLLPGILLSLLGVLFLSCNLSRFSPLHVCTQMGCRDTLVVNLSGNVPETFTIEATGADQSQLRATCSRGETASSGIEGGGLQVVCSPTSVTFFNFTPEEVTIKLAWETGEASELFRPTYASFRPNGPDCPPECRSGKVELRIP